MFHSGLYNNSIFGQKLPIQTTNHTFLESRHPEVTKNPYYVLFPEWSQKLNVNHYDSNRVSILVEV